MDDCGSGRCRGVGADVAQPSDELSANLPPTDRRAVRNAIANSVLQGRQPSATDIANLVTFAAGTISMAEYLTLVTQDRPRLTTLSATDKQVSGRKLRR